MEDVRKEDKELYQWMIGSLNYLAYYTCIDITFVYSLLMRYLYNPSPVHLKAGKWILWYLAGTHYYTIQYTMNWNKADGIFGFSDASYTNDKSSAKSHSEWVFFISGGIISLSSKL